MSKRLRQKGRYPKGPVAHQSSNANPPVAVSNASSAVPFYGPPQQAVPQQQQAPQQQVVAPQQQIIAPQQQVIASQQQVVAQHQQEVAPQHHAEHNNWTHHSYSNPHVYPPQNQIHTQPTVSGYYWSGAQDYTTSVQPPPENDPWKWGTESSTNTPNNYNNYTQPVAQQDSLQHNQWPSHQIDHQAYAQQEPVHQVDHQAYSQQEPANCNSTSDSLIQSNVVSSEYHTTNNNSNLMGPEALQSSWETTELNITQPGQLPWTYGCPQYYNQQPADWQHCSSSQNPPDSATQNVWTGNVEYPAFTGNGNSTDNIADYQPSQSISNDLHSKMESLNINSNNLPEEQMNHFNFDAQRNEVSLISSSFASSDNVCNLTESATGSECDSGTLSAFFQNDNKCDIPKENYPKPDYSSIPDSKDDVSVSSGLENATELNLPISEHNSHVSDSDISENLVEDKNRESSFIQEENSSMFSTEQKLQSTSISPIGFVEEPINQEVPEPPTNEITNSKASTVVLQPFVNQPEADHEPIEEPLNQQIPVESERTSSASSTEKERVIIRPREESPFKPPRQSVNIKSSVVQQKTPIKSHEQKQHEEKTIVQEVNLETLPDNLERPPDYEELRKQSPLYISHNRHLRHEMNTSPSSLLSDNLPIPCVTLAPAAPPLQSSAKSDLSESSNDSKLDNASYPKNSTLISNLSASEESPVHVSSKSVFSETQVPSDTSFEISSTSTSNGASRELKNINNSTVTSPSHLKKTDIDDPKSSRSEIQQIEDIAQKQYVALRDSKIEATHFSNGRSSAPIRKSYEHYAETDRREPMYPLNASYSNIDPRYLDNRPDSARQTDRREPMYPLNASYSNIDPRYLDNRPNSARQRYPNPNYPTADERSYSRPSSRASSEERNRSYTGDGDPRRQLPQDYDRPPSRMSEADMARQGKHPSHSGYYPNQYPYPNYPRQEEYRQRQANYPGYEYDSYRRDPYYASYYDAYRYAYSNYNYGFYDELYRNDPRYRQYREAQEQYRQYYAKYGYGADYERSSVHSGRSSANELTKEVPPSQYPEPDIDSSASEYSLYNNQQYYPYGDVPNENEASILEVADKASTPSARLTPVKFSYAHPIARFSGGLLISVIPSQGSLAVAAPIQIYNLQSLMEDQESFSELKSYQGPLIRGSTHKNDVIEFCIRKINYFKEKSDVVDRDSYILLWELMVLLLRQNGSVAGSDIAELLLKDHEVLRPLPLPLKHAIETPQGEHSPADINDSSGQSHAGDTSSPDEGIVVLLDKTTLNTSQTVDIDKITRKFREFLLFGHKKDALEWAMKHGLWGHALFLASKMELRTYANVMTRFANSLALNDPLQTLYQLMSGRQPSAVTFVADKKWGDWRPHLAMILSNPSSHPDVDSRSITTLGDTLASRGCLPAAHFCYIMAQVEFGTYEQKNSKFVLLSSDHLASFEEFATNEAIQCTEIYEYAQSLANPGFMLIHLQTYKFFYAMRLVEHGFLEEALHYCEVISENFQAHPHLFSFDIISEVLKLATQLKYHDPHFLRGQGEWEDQDDPEWLKNLTVLVQNYNNTLRNEIPPSPSNQEPIQNISANEGYSSPTNEPATYQNLSKAAVRNESYASTSNQGNYYQPTNWGQPNNMEYSTAMPLNNSSAAQDVGYYQGDITSNQNNFRRDSNAVSHEENETTDVPSSPVTQTPPFDYFSGSMQQVHESRQSIQESVNSFSSSTTQRERRDSTMSTGSRYSSGSLSVANKSSAKENLKSEAKKEKPNSQVGKTWLGGIFSRLLPKAPNQMILPDDNNPTIVWDSTKNCWVNKDSNDEDEINAPVAPPTDTELMGTRNSMEMPTHNMQPPIAMSPTNKFQRPKTRVMRQNYVDVLNPGSNLAKPNVPTEALFPSPQAQSSAPKMFIPSSAPSVPENPSEYASIGQSPLSAQPIIEAMEQPQSQNSSPLMLDPAEFDSRRSGMGMQRHTLGRTGRRAYPS